MRRFRIFISFFLIFGLMSAYAFAEEQNEPFSFTSAILDAVTGTEIDLYTLLKGMQSGQKCTFTVSDTTIAEIKSDGHTLVILTGGRCTVTAILSTGQKSTILLRTSNALPLRRALLLSEYHYNDGRIRTGAINTVEGMADALASQEYRNGSDFEITTLVDSSLAQIRQAVLTTFADISRDDFGILYISCHGIIQNGRICMVLHDSTAMTVNDLESILSPVQCRLLILIDCCASGALISASSSGFYAKSAADSFRDSSLFNGKHLIMVSCGSNEESYRMSDNGDVSENAMATVFARSLCEGIGWDIIHDRSVSLRADINNDGSVSFMELFLYTKKRVCYHLEGTGVQQTVMIWPTVSEEELFARQTP